MIHATLKQLREGLESFLKRQPPTLFLTLEEYEAYGRALEYLNDPLYPVQIKKQPNFQRIAKSNKFKMQKQSRKRNRK